MEHRLQQEVAHFETAVASLRAPQTLQDEVVATKETKSCVVNFTRTNTGR